MQAADGVEVNLTRIIGGPELDMLDSFLLLDEFSLSFFLSQPNLPIIPQTKNPLLRDHCL